MSRPRLAVSFNVYVDAGPWSSGIGLQGVIMLAAWKTAVSGKVLCRKVASEVYLTECSLILVMNSQLATLCIISGWDMSEGSCGRLETETADECRLPERDYFLSCRFHFVRLSLCALLGSRSKHSSSSAWHALSSLNFTSYTTRCFSILFQILLHRFSPIHRLPYPTGTRPILWGYRGSSTHGFHVY